MKIAIIGVGNMGGAIAKGLANIKSEAALNICIANRTKDKLDKLKTECPQLQIASSFEEAVKDTDLVILAVKPWAIQETLSKLDFTPNQTVASVAAGITFAQLSKWTKGTDRFYRIIPNTAISYLASMNIIASQNTSTEDDQEMLQLFNNLGTSILLPESKMEAATAIASCGIAYLFKYIQASMQAGIELGLTPSEAKLLASQAAVGAGTILLRDPQAHPATEIDKVTTPGGITIKGVNELDKQGFTTAIIEAIKKSV